MKKSKIKIANVTAILSSQVDPKDKGWTNTKAVCTEGQSPAP